MGKLIDTIQFAPTQHRHAVAGDGRTQCFVAVEGQDRRRIERKRAAEVNCWQCRKRGRLLRAKNGQCLTATAPGLKVHRIAGRPGKRPARLTTPCHLDFTGERGAEVKRRSHADVNCGHCMRFSFA